MKGLVLTRPNGRYQAVVDVGRDPFTGKRRRVAQTCDTEDEAQLALARLIIDHTGKEPAAKGITVGHMLTKYLASLSPDDYSPSTLREYRAIVRHTLHPAFGDLPVAKLTTERIDAFYTHLRTEAGAGGRPVSQARCRRIQAVLNPACKMAVRYRWLRENPAGEANLGKLRRRRADRKGKVTAAQVGAVLAECGPYIYDVAMLAIATSRRAGELCGIQWCDVDFEVETVEILRTVARGDDGLEVVDDDRRKSEDTILALDSTVAQLLKARRVHAVENALAFGVPLGEDAYVFSEVPGGVEPLSPAAVSQRWRIAAKRAGEPVRFHDLRHFSISTLLEAGLSVPSVAEIAGHDPTMTASVYAHALERVNREATAALAPTLARWARPTPDVHGC